jgi:hypothetical protein
MITEFAETPTGLPQVWGSGGYRRQRMKIIGGSEALPEVRSKSAIVDGASNLEQQIGPAS